MSDLTVSHDYIGNKYRHAVWPTYITWYTLFQNANLFRLEMTHRSSRLDFFQKSKLHPGISRATYVRTSNFMSTCPET